MSPHEARVVVSVERGALVYSAECSCGWRMTDEVPDRVPAVSRRGRVVHTVAECPPREWSRDEVDAVYAMQAHLRLPHAWRPRAALALAVGVVPAGWTYRESVAGC